MTKMLHHFEEPSRLSTNRLDLRPFELGDAPGIFSILSDDRTLRYLDRPKVKDLEDSVNLIDKVTDLVEKGEAVNWAICEKGSTKLIGTVCLWNLQPENGMAELGYTLHPEYWGKGIASEAIDVVLDFGFNTLKAMVVEAFVQPANQASLRLLEKKGFQKTGSDEIHDRYSLLAPPYGTALLQTDRLVLRELSMGDANFLLVLLNTPDWLKNIGDRGVSTIVDARNYLLYRLTLNCRLKGFGFYGMALKASGDLVGICGLVKRDFLGNIDIGYALLPKYYGHGYALEAAKGLMNYAESQLKLPKIAAITIESNLPSIKLLEKLGLAFERKLNLPDDPATLLLYGKQLRPN